MPETPGQGDIQSAILANAFAFLQRAIDDFKTDLRFSVVNFASATELFLKARLVEEHWSLLFKDTDRASIDALQRGEFISVTVGQAIKRLRTIAGVSFSQEAEANILKLVGHRNRAIHFTMDVPEPEQEQTEIAIEQLTGWMHLQRLLRQWFGESEEFLGHLWRVNNAMKAQREFLQLIFENVQQKIEEERQAGKTVTACRSCLFEASVLTDLTAFLSESHCLVCSLWDVVVKMTCPECGEVNELSHYEANYPECSKCEHQLEASELEEILDTEQVEYPHGIEKNCAECTGYHSVVEHEAYYVCVECFGYADELQVCEWCNEGQINGGDLELSFYTGCEFCDGKGGWDAD